LIVSTPQLSSTSPLEARKSMARLCDSQAALPGRPGGTTRGSSEGGGASNRIRRAHRPRRRPRRSRKAVGTEVHADIVLSSFWPSRWPIAGWLGQAARESDPSPVHAGVPFR
jgi:hypothetical protein